MIAIHKGTAPRDLVRAGEEHAKELCAAYEADPEPFQSGKKMGIRKSIYASRAVKAELEACHRELVAPPGAQAVEGCPEGHSPAEQQ